MKRATDGLAGKFDREVRFAADFLRNKNSENFPRSFHFPTPPQARPDIQFCLERSLVAMRPKFPVRQDSLYRHNQESRQVCPHRFQRQVFQ